MQTAFSVAAFLLTALVLLANPGEKLNRWCSLAIFFFFLGVVKEALVFEILPAMQSAFALPGLVEGFAPFHSFFTWVIYTLAMPTMAVAACYFGYMDLDRKNPLIKWAIYIPGLSLMPFFSPLKFIAYQDESFAFWAVYAAYNLLFGAAVACMAHRGISIEKKGQCNAGVLKKKRTRRWQEAALLLPPLYIWYLSIFPGRLLYHWGFQGAEALFESWQWNLITIIFVILMAIYYAVKGEGFFGVRIVPIHYGDQQETRNSEFMSSFIHRMKSETSYMTVKLEKMKDALNSGPGIPDIYSTMYSDIEELLDKINALNRISRKFIRYSNDVVLSMRPWNLTGLLHQSKRTDIDIHIHLDEEICLKCDRSLIIEVFKDIIDNSVQAVRQKPAPGRGRVDITGVLETDQFKLTFKDNGVGIAPHRLADIFNPGETTKNKEYNSGLGLVNCQKIINEHGGSIYAASDGVGQGASMVLTFPIALIDWGGDGATATDPSYQDIGGDFSWTKR